MMFIAHMPAGYLITRYIQHRCKNRSLHVLWLGLIASVFPDIDLFYFFLIDHRSTAHHHYITHLPLAWLALSLIIGAILITAKKRHYFIFLGVAFANVMLHMVLDSIAATIYWLYPLYDMAINLIDVTPRYHWWVWNFLLHWTFLYEILIIILALHVWARPCKKPY
jgi:inner membrane protein